MDEIQIRRLILDQFPGRKISCREAFEVAEKLGLSKKRLGQILNDLKIKVYSCQLGCFN